MVFMRTLDGLDLQYREIGRGPAILFSHEFGGNHASWEKQVERLAVAHRCIVYTARGFSPSTVSDRAVHYGRDLMVRDLVELARHLQLESFHLVGAAMGAATALLAAELLGDKIRTITLVGCPSGPLSQLDLFDHRSRIRQMLLALEQDEVTLAALTLYRQRPYERLIKEKAAWHHKYRSIMAEQDAAGLALTLKSVEWDPPNFRQRERQLRQIKAPTLLAIGDEDHPSVRTANVYLARALASAKEVKIAGCGRLAHIEQPAVFNRLLWQHVRNFELGENGQKHYSKPELSLHIDHS